MSRGPNEKPEKEIELENKFENMGAQMVREVASKTSEQAGDGRREAHKKETPMPAMPLGGGMDY